MVVGVVGEINHLNTGPKYRKGMRSGSLMRPSPLIYLCSCGANYFPFTVLNFDCVIISLALSNIDGDFVHKVSSGEHL